MDKPGGVSQDEYERMLSLMKEKGLVFQTGYMYRYNPVIAEKLAAARRGDFGEIYSVEAHMDCIHPKEKRAWLGDYPGGMMYYLGCHLIDLVLQIQGEPLKIIPFNKTTGAQNTDAKDFSFAVFEYERGTSFVKTTQAERGGFSKRHLVVNGTKGRFEVSPLEINVSHPLQATEYNECKGTDWNAEAECKRSANYDRYDAMMLSFAEMVRGEKENPYTYDYELALYKTVQKCCTPNE